MSNRRSSNFRDPLSKIKSALVLKKLLINHRGPRGKIVFTNGVFDILHKGHVTYLNQARKLGTLLIVALNDDASVKKLKGPERPVNTLQDRMNVIAGLECVDFVTSFSDDTPLKTIQTLKPNIHVKGGDYKISQLVEADAVVEWGGSVKILPFVDGYSTTSLIKKFKS